MAESRQKSRRACFTSLVVALVLCVGCAEGETLSADQVVDNMVDATASERTRSSIQSLTATANCSGPGGEFETTVTSIRPDTVYFRQASARGIREIWSTPERTWGGRAGENYDLLTPQVRDFVRGHEFHLLIIDVRTRFSGFELRGVEQIGDTDCLRITMTDETGGDASMCVRRDSWLPLELRLAAADSPGPLRVEFGEWRSVDGLNLFHTLQLTEDDGEVFHYDYVDVSVNTFAYEMQVPAPALPRVRPGAGR